MADYENQPETETRDEDEAAKEAAPLADYPAEAPNLVPFFRSAGEEGVKFLKQVAEKVCDETQAAWDSTEEWREKRADNNRIITGWLKKKTFPFVGSANAHMPIALERVLRLSSNMYVEIFSERDTIFGVKPTGPDDFADAEVLTYHGNWQIMNEQTDFFRQQHRGVWEFNTAGSVFAYSWRDTIKDRNRHDILTCDDVFLPYVWTSVETDCSDMPYKGRWVRKYRHELEALKARGEWDNIDAVLAKGPPAWDVVETRAREEGGKHEGIVAPENNKNAPYLFQEYHGWCQMPGGGDQRPVVVIVDKTTKEIVKFFIREEEDWRDRERFDREMAELEQHVSDLQMVADLQGKQEELRMALMDPGIHPEDRAAMEAALAEPLPESPPPEWMASGKTQPDPVKKVPTEMFSHGVCVENPFGALGLSFGAVVCDLNKLADEAFNRVYDQATLGNTWSIITGGDLDFGTSTIPIGPGKVIRVKGVTGEQLKNQMHELRPAAANPQLLEIVGMSQAAADSSIAAPSVLSGEAGKSGETFRGLATRVERATRQLSAAGMKYLDFLGNILKNNARLNALFMPEEEILHVMDHLDLPAFLAQGRQTPQTRGLREIRVGRDMYRRNYSVTFTADVRFASQQQRITEADEVVGMSQHPALASNLAFAWHALSKALRARGQHDLLPTLGPPPPMPTTPMGIPKPPAMGPDGMPMDAAMGEAMQEVDELTPGSEPIAPPDGIPRPAVAPGPIQGPQQAEAPQ